jgi:hypothetical protein
VLGYAVRSRLVDENAARLVPNPEPKRREVPAFGTLADVEAVALERRDVDRETGPAPCPPGLHRRTSEVLWETSPFAQNRPVAH